MSWSIMYEVSSASVCFRTDTASNAVSVFSLPKSRIVSTTTVLVEMVEKTTLGSSEYPGGVQCYKQRAHKKWRRQMHIRL